jgi:UDP-N-acetylmuramoyl-L-alanyl-D-glutamate--2,6-diaminopimelate ligase
MAKNSTSKQTETVEKPLFQIRLHQAIACLKDAKLLSAEFKETLLEADTPLILEWDTRRLPNTTNIIFLGRKGNRFDSNAHAKTIIGKGLFFCGEISGVIRQLRLQGNNETFIRSIIENPRFIPVEDAPRALELLLDAAADLSPSAFRSVAITGTSGKTSTTQITGQLLHKLTKKDILRIGSLGIHAGDRHWEGEYPTMPDYPGFITAFRQAAALGIEHAVFEATSHGLTEKRMGQWKVDVGVFTNFSQDHLDFHKTMESYRSCKGILFENHIKDNGSVVLSVNDPEWLYFARRVRSGNRKIMGFGGTESRVAFEEKCPPSFERQRYLEVSNVQSSTTGIQGEWTLFEKGKPICKAPYTSVLIGEFQHENLAAAASVLIEMGFNLADIATLTPEVTGIPGRLEPLVVNACSPHATVLVDYAHKPDALEKALKTVRATIPSESKLVCVFGCGGDRDSSKRSIMGRIASQIASKTFVTSDNPRTEDPEKILDDVMQGVIPEADTKRITSRREAIFEAILTARTQDVVIIAGKGHEDYQIIGTEKEPFSDFEVAREALLAKKS